MIRVLKAYFIRRRFEKLFADEMKRVQAQRLRHLQINPSQAHLQERVHDALRRGLGA